MSGENLQTAFGGVTLADALFYRRSVRKFAAEPLHPDRLRAALEAASLAPSPHGSAPWRFCIVATPEARLRLATEMGRDFLRDMEREGVPEEERKRRHAGSLRLITGAPALILAALSYKDLDRYEDPAKQANERMMAEHSLGAALQNLMLALAAQGIGSVWRCAPLFCPETARKALSLPEDWVPRAYVAAGRAAVPPPARPDARPAVLVR